MNRSHWREDVGEPSSPCDKGHAGYTMGVMTETLRAYRPCLRALQYIHARMTDNTRNITWGQGECRHGTFIVARCERRVCWLALGNDPDVLQQEMLRAFEDEMLSKMTSDDTQWLDRVRDVLDGRLRIDALPVLLEGTAFQQAVWQALRDIPHGETRTYKEIAVALGRPTASRAVGTAIGQNHIAVLIPCHRVIRSDGGLSGFRWGVERKRALQAQEATQRSLDL